MTKTTSAVLVCALGLASAVTLRADVRATKRDATLLKQKVAAINAEADKPTKAGRRTIVTESEVNSYLMYEAREQIPVGVVDPSITVVGANRLSARAIVDLDAVRKQKAPTSLLDPMNYLMGRLAVTAVGKLTTAKGVGHFSRTPEKPGGIGLDDPFPLPARIREIQVDRGQAIIVQ
jgi:hypothetical protein